MTYVIIPDDVLVHDFNGGVLVLKDRLSQLGVQVLEGVIVGRQDSERTFQTQLVLQLSEKDELEEL